MNVQCPHCRMVVLRTSVICYSCRGPVAEYYEYYEIYHCPPPQNYSYRPIPYNQPYYGNNVGYRQPVYTPRGNNSGCAVLFVIAIIVVVILSANHQLSYSTSSASADGQSSSSSSSSSASIDAANNTLNAYYNHINAHEYQAAYDLWYVNGQRSQTYAEFVAGYAQTLHDDLTIKDAEELNDGTVQLNVTLVAQGPRNSTTYRGYYNVGQRDGEWKLISGQLS